ncbi:dipeptidyl peptidase variant [Zalerion maritima]|uniref:Dipeptidyl-peptidase V n=1 Tax=Zalerion maritima TaxID=339359 RepID=A0AAD5RWM0_9PEZI|nr:dipeptidyl peptidase variant [Zalerion maritima]
MTIQAAKFTPEVLLSAPRRTPGLPNSTGEQALYTVSSYSFATHSKTTQIRLLDIQSGKSSVLFENAEYSEPTWVSETEFIFFSRPPGGSTVLAEADLADLPHLEPREIALLPGSFSSMKVKTLSKNVVAMACVAVAKPDGTPYDPYAEPKKYTSARVYDSLFVRHWDSYITENTNSVWYGRLEKRNKGKGRGVGRIGGDTSENQRTQQNQEPRRYASEGASSEQQQQQQQQQRRHPTTHQSCWKLEGEGLTNLLAGQGLECPVPPFGGASDFDISHTGIAFVARDPELSPAIYAKTNCYFVPLTTFTETSPPAPKPVSTPGLEGYSSAPAFSPCGKSLVFGRMRSKQYESDKPRVMLVSDVDKITEGAPADEFWSTQDGDGGWDLRPDWFLWSRDEKELFAAAERNGRTVLWQFPSNVSEAATGLPTPVVADGSVNDAKLLGADGKRLLVTSTSMVDSSIYSIITPVMDPEVEVVSSNSKGGRSFGLSRSQFDEFWFRSGGPSCSSSSPGNGNSSDDGGYDVHALVMKPSNFDPCKKYPLAMLIHGGPQGAWLDGWSTRWNPAIFAEQGYVAVMPNPTGSTGYGMALEDGIRENWGGRPYQDLVNCFEHIERELEYVDTERAVALGASYGGYMINWIQGHPLGRKFKALVCHDGVFSTLNQYSSEELYFPIHDFGGTLWDNREVYERWDPARFSGNWATPQLIIHNELDYRLPISEGLAAFNVLQSRGVPSKFVTFPDENHWVLKPENSMVWHTEVLNWINNYSGIAGEIEGTAFSTAAASGGQPQSQEGEEAEEETAAAAGLLPMRRS